ncbi:CHAD domain-containing protein [Pseudorhodoplanes sinuspersici]|uniref:Uncharacterized protein n=1 Tax=Pseudorhodoplanes sinuspersici TaxID=1235591 RepID=A0A1W6ZTN3_9HYPH|nr:CHAD domain-containing protein [Pseudorhodoplanes sinuspersici]ARQ00757.1 hypothetical protein CAK95_17945 [Pseudorhodoplanes sinuspersici]RKE72369.1 CHAD domain-containing protein [Pseudorhodoplanes sinuspersici]
MSTHPALKPGQPVGAALRDVAAAVVAEAQAILGDGNGDPTKTVHGIRRTFKRWRALLRMLAPFVDESGHQLRIDARELARKLGGARDAQATIDAFRDAAAERSDHSVPFSSRSIATIEGRLEAQRTSHETEFWNPQIRQEMSDYLAAAAAQVAQWDLNEVTFSDLADMLAKTYRRARGSIPKSWDETEAEDLHELRRRVVEHRYQMELIEPAWPRLGKIWVDEAQRLRTRLGKFQDLAVLTEKTGPHQTLAPWRSKLVPLIAQRQAEHAQAARKMAARMFAEPPKAFRRRIEALWDAQAEEAET